jgi:hypothetical protein
MKLFVVRYSNTKRVIGIFWCRDLAELAELVDEQTDPPGRNTLSSRDGR